MVDGASSRFSSKAEVQLVRYNGGMESLPPFRLRPEPANAEAEEIKLGFEWASDEVGHRHQLGGSPRWIQGDETPTCLECGETMTFYGQFDSVNDDFVLADCGLVYVFVCFNDFSANAIVQSH